MKIVKLAVISGVLAVADLISLPSYSQSIERVFELANNSICHSVEQKLNHYAYKEVSRSLLVPVGNGQLLHKDAAIAFIAMKQAAKKEGIYLQPISGFRSIKEQNYLFYKVAKQRRQTWEKRAKVSAPPGYSQHHTGFAIDINSLNQSFANTKTYAWLLNNAAKYGFHLSFNKNNSQGVSFEPWHWAWHGSDASQLALHDKCI